MELKVRRLREIIASTIGEDLIAEGFSIDKSLTWIKKTVNKKNKIHFLIDCYNYAPVHLEFRLIISFWISEILSEMEKYHHYLNESFNSKGELFIFSEGDFNPLVKNLELKFRNAYTHIVTDINDTEIQISECRKTLREEIIPLLPTLSVLEKFQDYVLENYKDPEKSWLAKTGIIAMKLKGAKELEMVVDYFWKSLELDKKPKDNYFRNYVENIITYSKTQ